MSSAARANSAAASALSQCPLLPYRFGGFRVEMPETTPVSFPPVDLNISRHFMPEEVIAHDIRGEFRQVVNLFMRFPDLPDKSFAS